MFKMPLQKSFYRTFFVLITFLLTNAFVFAQEVKDDTTSNLSPLNTNPPVTPQPLPEVTKVVSCDPAHPNRSGLGDDILVTIKNAPTFFADAKDADAKVILFVNNKPVRDVVYEFTQDGVRFFMPNEGDVTELWDYLMGSRGEDEFFEKQVSVSVGLESLDSSLTALDPIPTKIDGKGGRSLTLILVNKTWFVICILFMLTIVILFIVVGKRSDMLRDTGPDPVTGRKPFSLARVQMAIWFLVIISSWLLLYVCLHHFDLLSEKILILMGITSATGIGGLALDANKTKTVPAPSEGLLKDLISDHSNISLFRFQNFAWTLVLVVVFIRSVIVYLKMPEFDITLLTLMGISSGTYIGAKVTEKRGEEAAAADDVNPAQEEK